MKKTTSPKPTDAQQVESWMATLDAPHKADMELLRAIIKEADGRLGERIKWNAPCYYYKEDLLTFGPRRKDAILLVFHHRCVVQLSSPLLEGDFKDRRLAWFRSTEQIRESQAELTRIIRELVALVEQQQ